MTQNKGDCGKTNQGGVGEFDWFLSALNEAQTDGVGLSGHFVSLFCLFH